MHEKLISIDNVKKVAFSEKQPIQDQSAKTIPYVKPKWPKLMPYL